MLSKFFIDRPVFANVIAIVTILLGVVALYRLPVERYPAIVPPTVVVSAAFPGANPKVVATTINQKKPFIKECKFKLSKVALWPFIKGTKTSAPKCDKATPPKATPINIKVVVVVCFCSTLAW